MQCTRRLRKEWSANDAKRAWICARCTKGTNQRLSYEGIFVYHWFVRSRENLIARAKPYLEDKGRRWRHTVDCARVSEFSGYSLQKSPYIAAPYCFLWNTQCTMCTSCKTSIMSRAYSVVECIWLVSTLNRTIQLCNNSLSAYLLHNS